jgi:FkbM family methyltransferase
MSKLDPATVTSDFADAKQWLGAMFRAMFSLVHHFEKDNFDIARYGKVIQPNVFLADKHAAYLSFLVDNQQSFFHARSLFDDSESRNLFDQLVLFRLLGHLHVRLPFNNEETRGFDSIAEGWRIGDTKHVAALGGLSLFQIPMSPHPMRLQCWTGNVSATFLVRQYYFNRDKVSVEVAPGDHVIDAGGCFGDTALYFASVVGGSGHVYTFDPLPRHCAIIRENLLLNPVLAPKVSVFELALSNASREGRGFDFDDGTINPGATAFDDAISTRTVDDLVADRMIDRVDFIKMDVEGSELAALMGAERVLRVQRPRLAISLYHRPEDFFSIPLWLHRLGCGYKFFLDHYSIHNEETVLYAKA